MRGVRLRQEEYRKNASSAERDIVDYISSDLEAAVGQSIHKLAAQTCLCINGCQALQKLVAVAGSGARKRTKTHSLGCHGRR